MQVACPCHTSNVKLPLQCLQLNTDISHMLHVPQVTFEACDIFGEQGSQAWPRADLYVLCRILHDWEEPRVCDWV